MDKALKLSKNFTLGEFVVSMSFKVLAEKIEPTAQQISNLMILCAFGLQPIRDKYGEVIITSGLRSKELNAMLGGVDSSQHVDGSAVDFQIIGQDMQQVYWYLHPIWPGELIYYKKKGHIHIALPKYGTKSDHFVKDA